ncbi:hypothetical protein [Ectopseudomonas oleovorans]|uniref:Uncharacterized protein n=1 Tax=Ectopseudomonas oleovorans TaxID=301 RepID=A0A3R8VWQ5_ECTOL|nr:hypothetical protein [Pseudomonas oleovorans]RRW33534.1 hypothetical protein EGJ44_15130 [Pseudomonas oleovorans]
MSSMQHQEVDFSRPQNQDLIWDLDSMARRKLAERFIKLFENRLCVYSEMVVLPNPYAFHDTLHGIDSQAIRKTGLCVLPGKVLGKPGLLLSPQIKDDGPAPKTMPFKPALAQIISNQKKIGDLFLPVLMKGDLREFDQQMPYIHLHRLQLARLERLSSFERDDIQQTITRKLLTLYRQADSLVC